MSIPFLHFSNIYKINFKTLNFSISFFQTPNSHKINPKALNFPISFFRLSNSYKINSEAPRVHSFSNTCHTDSNIRPFIQETLNILQLERKPNELATFSKISRSSANTVAYTYGIGSESFVSKRKKLKQYPHRVGNRPGRMAAANNFQSPGKSSRHS